MRGLEVDTIVAIVSNISDPKGLLCKDPADGALPSSQLLRILLTLVELVYV